MFRVSTWVLLGIIAASMFAWVLRGGSLDGPRVAGWTDLGTWGWGTKVADLSKAPEKPVTAKVAVVEKVAPAEKSDKAEAR